MAAKEPKRSRLPSIPVSADTTEEIKIKMTAEELPHAIGALFELNNYQVEYGKKIHGSEIDIIATSITDFLAPVVYIEATVQYVDVIKYGKDLTKFSLVRTMDQSCKCISISTAGFTPDVEERAAQTNILTQTYDQIFSKFENFSSYINQVLGNSAVQQLVSTYEEPYFKDASGEVLASDWLTQWRDGKTDKSNWLVILGEYGTGKTALTLKLQFDWIKNYKENPKSPIIIRIELRNFNKQFDARSLIHHFLDNNKLGHLPIDFVFHLIRSRRILLILDGYDEMAQFLNARERRSCLGALAELASEGAKGILTSRPNYFTESEELNVFEALYSTIEKNKYYVSQIDKIYIAGEKSIDSLLNSYLINRNERYLRDLSQEQTIALVQRKLSGDPAGQKIVLDLLKKVFREERDGRRQLSGKPVIISYLLELIEELRNDEGDQNLEVLTEWQIYKLIVDRLMLRDLQRSPMLDPQLRREGLQRVAIRLSGRSATTGTEEIFLEIIDDLFKVELRRMSAEERRSRRDTLFQDIRSSSTLTRVEGATGWIFSHASLREYLVAEAAVASVLSRNPIEIDFPISMAMRSFVSSLSLKNAQSYIETLSELWMARSNYSLGGYISLSWDLFKVSGGGMPQSLKRITGSTYNFRSSTLKNIDFTKLDFGCAPILLNMSDCDLVEISFKEINLSGSSFNGSTLDQVSYASCDLSNCNFRGAFLFECDFGDSIVSGSDFTDLDKDSSFTVKIGVNIAILNGKSAVGYLNFNGGITDSIEPYYILEHHPKFSIVIKICEHITEQKNSQLRGLTQRGVATNDPNFARDFVDYLKQNGLIAVDKKDLVSATTAGRAQLTRLVDHKEMPSIIEKFLFGSR
ncbi:hypothetical protein CSQ91_07170 [Janthinobacterium sp. BJB301]|uniref:NACHT domain-containing protein n=1 Tax=Janthinobacterium sp. BJB301 TaxID=1560195 RepID=UPI000C0E99B6|nr:NACHT domain-containing protein [Janthinobacterium sp. BJB301]PHV50915.1 hypothetical protein CSQ91_07170 [Janthinobacterium sp. BJB301]